MAAPTKANVPRPSAWGYDCLIEYGPDDDDSLYVRLAVGPGRQMQFQTVAPEQRGPSTLENPEDMRSESGTPFSRSEFSGGEGLRRAHRRDGTDRDWSRFFASANVDVSEPLTGEKVGVRLSPPIEMIEGGAESNVASPDTLATDGDTLFAVLSDRHRVDVYSSPLDSSPTASTENPHDGEGDQDITGLAVLDDELYAAVFTNGIHLRSSGGSWSHWSDLTTLDIWAVKERIIASTGADLYEAAAGSGSVLLRSLPSGRKWVDVVDAGSVLLAAASNGTIYHFADEDGELVLVGQTALEGTPVAMAAVRGLLFVTTEEQLDAPTVRLWRAAVIGQRVSEAQVLRVWGSGTLVNRASERMVVDRDAVWLAVIESAGPARALWRYDLITGGLSRYSDLSNDANSIHGMVAIEGRIFLSALRSTTSDEALWREDSVYGSSGYLISPLADFYNDETKTWLEVRMRLGAMPANTQVVLAYSTDPDAIDDPNHASWTDAITATTTGGHTKNLVGVESRWMALKATLSTSDTAETPEVLSFTARAALKPSEQDYQIPVNISDQLELPHRKRLRVQGLGETTYGRLQALVGKSATVTLLRPSETVEGQIRAVSSPINELPERGSPTVYALVTVRGERQAS